MTTSSDVPIVVQAWIACPHCRAPNSPVISALFTAYFAKIPLPCPQCGKPIDWWQTLHDAALDHFMLTGAFHLLGSTTTIVQVEVPVGKVITVDLVAAGVDPKAELLSINFTGQGGGVLPLRVHGNVPRHDPTDKKIIVYGAALGTAGSDPPKVSVAATWIVTSNDELPFRSLVAAFREYDLGRYDAAVVPANVAVEASIGRAVFDWMLSFSNKKRAKEFLSNAATYSYQINELLPVICHTTGVPVMPDDLRGRLNRLRSHRNDVAHRGAPETPISKNIAAEFVTAAVFGFHYAHLLHAEVLRAQINGRIPKAGPA